MLVRVGACMYDLEHGILLISVIVLQDGEYEKTE